MIDEKKLISVLESELADCKHGYAIDICIS